MSATPDPVTPLPRGVVNSAARAAFLFYLLRGLLALGFGLFALFAPRSTAHAIVIVFGVFAVIDGVIGLVAAYVLRGARWNWLISTSLLGIAVGVVAIAWPQTTVVAVMLLIALWALAIGAFAIKGSFDLKRGGDSGWYWTLIAGLVSVALAVVLLFRPTTVVATIIVILGIFAIVYGVVQVVNAFRVRSLPQRVFVDEAGD